MSDELFKRLLCLGCGFSYDEALGLPEHGLAPGTRWAMIKDIDGNLILVQTVK